MSSLDLKNVVFDGAGYSPSRDNNRLKNQLARIFALMKDGHWRTLREIAGQTNDPETSVSAQLRHMRKRRFGGHLVKRRHVRRGLYQYQLVVREENASNESLPQD
jgi:hypothetical protein